MRDRIVRAIGCCSDLAIVGHAGPTIPLVLSLTATSCSGDTTSTPDECGGGDCGVACADDTDNDGDGRVDCLDGDCADAPNCLSAAYGIPYETACDDGADNDNDLLVDCADDDCADAPSCQGADYAVVMEDCTDGIDNDGDTLVDCVDDDCVGDPNCPGLRYGIPN